MIRIFTSRGGAGRGPAAAGALALVVLAGAAGAQAGPEVPKALQGPFVARADVMERLDRLDPGGDCGRSGPLAFACLIQARAAAAEREAPAGALANPFRLRVSGQIAHTIQQDLKELAKDGPEGDRTSLNPNFFEAPGSRVELVGVVNRIDRQFIKDRVAGSEDHERCGEISVVYRFSYAAEGVQSRLPVTMNVVFPAIPLDRPSGAATCRDVAARWKAEMDRPSGRSADEVVATLTDPKTGILAPLTGRDIERIELNLQAYRITASGDRLDFGSTAEYVIRVFRWDGRRFAASYLTNQIDRARLLGNPRGDGNSCEPGKAIPLSLAEFRAYLTSRAVLFDIDTGTLNIPEKYLACRATTVSPGGPHRSRNQPFWNAPTADGQIVSDDQLLAARKAAESPARRFSFMRTADDIRTRLNELTCSGCHQARAIAGFHFPGEDRGRTPVSNAVLLPGSPHFYGDQPRRIEILERIAKGERLTRHDLAASYAARPLNRFRPLLEASTDLIGGWGGACLVDAALGPSQRKWTCNQDKGLVCRQLFKSDNAPGLGTCVPEKGMQIGDAMQSGDVVTERYGLDRYTRTDPPPEPAKEWADPKARDRRMTLIPDERLPRNPPKDNTYFAAHQEWYAGDDRDGDPTPERFANKRNAKTGGFPAGMLRLSECLGLPREATCGLLAASGFSDCLKELRQGKRTLEQCFVQRTSYAGVRACDAASPCRDDYICLRPLGYTAEDGPERIAARTAAVKGIQHPGDYGQKAPDAAWLARNGGRGDPRGLCIPPYFVFQFRSDGHPAP